jgi:hypothetical protein
MKIPCYPVRLASLYKAEPTGCDGCIEAWRLYKKARKLQKLFKKRDEKNENKHLLRRADWLLGKSAQALYEDRENHRSHERACSLYICSGRARRLYQFKCWNCEETLYVQHSKWLEGVFCKNCFATIWTDWTDGKIDEAEALAMYERGVSASGLWEDFYWSKKARAMKHRRKDKKE